MRNRRRARRTAVTSSPPPLLDDGPPGPRTWEFSQAYRWVEVEPPAVVYDIATGLSVTEAGETRESVRDGWYGPVD